MMYYMVCDKDGLKGLIYPKLKDKNPDFKITESLNKSFIYFLDKIKRKNNGDLSLLPGTVYVYTLEEIGIKESINGGYKSEKPLKITGKSLIDTGLKIKELEKLGEIL